MTPLEKLFKEDMHYFVIKDDGNCEKNAFHTQLPFPHVIVVADLKKTKTKQGKRAHKYALYFSEHEYKAFIVDDTLSFYDPTDGLVLFAAMHKKMGREEFDSKKFVVADYILERISHEVRKIAIGFKNQTIH